MLATTAMYVKVTRSKTPLKPVYFDHFVSRHGNFAQTHVSAKTRNHLKTIVISLSFCFGHRSKTQCRYEWIPWWKSNHIETSMALQEFQWFWDGTEFYWIFWFRRHLISHTVGSIYHTVGRQFMDVSKYVMFYDVFVHVDEVVLRECSKSPLNTSILGDFRPKEFGYTHIPYSWQKIYVFLCQLCGIWAPHAPPSKVVLFRR